jgi:nucleoside-diphosphate-sugar epimerase
MKYFVTGSTGFIGNAVARQLLGARNEVHALVRDRSKAAQLERLGARLFPGDVTDKDSMRAGMSGADAVFHIAGWYKVGARDKSPGERVNIQGTRNVLELMDELKVPRGVYTSTLAVNSDTRGRTVDETYHFDGAHLSEYDRSKAAAHALAIESIAGGLPLTIVMPGLVYGPGDTSSLGRNFRDYLRRRLPVIPAGSAFCWAHIDDIARAHLLSMEKGDAGQTYIIAGPPASVVEAFHLAAEITGIPAPRAISARVLSRLAALMGVVDRILPLPEAYTSEGLREVAGVTYLGTNDKARLALGYDPRPLRIGLEETLLHEMNRLGMRAARMPML